MDKPKNVYFLVGPSCVGKTTISESIKISKDEIVVSEIDNIFFTNYGDIIDFAYRCSWEDYLITINNLLTEILQNFTKDKKYLVTLPPSTLTNSINNEIAQKNRELLIGSYYIICLLAHKNHEKGAAISTSRHIKRNYKISVEEKKKRYIQEAEFYSSIADFIIYTNKSLKYNLEQIQNIITQNA